MKTKLLTALLILTTIPFFAHKAPVQKLSNAELLAHLKNVKAKITNYYNESAYGINEYALNNGLNIDFNIYKTNEDIFFENLTDEFYNQSKLLQQYVSDAINDCFDRLCNKIDPWDQLFNVSINPIITDADEKKLYKLFQSIYAKLHKKYCLDNPNGTLPKKTTYDLFENCIDGFFFIENFKVAFAVEEKIDAKIAELEAQL